MPLAAIAAAGMAGVTAAAHRVSHPLYLQKRENITRSPDVIAPIQVSPGNLIVRTVLEPHMAYPNARVAVNRHDQLPAWLLEAWVEYAEAGGVELEDE